MTPGPLPSATEAGDASTHGHHNQTSDSRTLQHCPFATSSAADAPDMLQASTAPPSLDDAGQPHKVSSNTKKLRLPPRASEMTASPNIPVDSQSYMDQGSQPGCGDSHHQPAADHQPGERIRPIRYFEPTPWNLSSRSANQPPQGSHSSVQGRSLEDSMGSSIHHLASRHTTSRGDGPDDVFTRTGAASRDRVGLDPPEGSLFDCNALIPGSFLPSSSESHPPHARTNVTQGSQQIAMSSSATSSARGGPPMAPYPGGYLHNHQPHRPSLLRSQSPTTASAIGNGGAFGGLPRLTIRAAVGSNLPSTSPNYHLTPLVHPRHEVHGRRYFGAPQLHTALRSPAFGLPRPPFSLPPHPVGQWPLLRHPAPILVQGLGPIPGAGNSFPPYPPRMASFEPPQAAHHHPPAGLHDAFQTMMRHGLLRAQIDQLPSYPFNPEVHEQVYCSVCVSEMESQEIVRVLPCKHKFHATCINNWLLSNRTCPNCRQDASVAASS